MPGAFIVFIVVGCALWFFRQTGRMSPGEVRAFSSRVFGIALLALAALLATRGAIAGALPVAAAGAGLLGFAKIWPMAAVRPAQRRSAPPVQPAAVMGSTEALSVLGLMPGASREDILAAHKRLQRTNHPDVGGSDYLAGKINQARDVLLKA